MKLDRRWEILFLPFILHSIHPSNRPSFPPRNVVSSTQLSAIMSLHSTTQPTSIHPTIYSIKDQTIHPTNRPSILPSVPPSLHPSIHPSLPSVCPSLHPSVLPSLHPSVSPSLPFSYCPSVRPSVQSPTHPIVYFILFFFIPFNNLFLFSDASPRIR